MKKLVKRIFKIVLMLVVVILALVLTINFPIAHFGNKTTEINYSSWMAETLSNDQKIIDIAMLGAHDAFTSDMTVFSQVDEESAESIQTGATGFLIKGFSYRQSKTQVSEVYDLLQSGVRYFDMRLTYNEDLGIWMTAHTYFSTPLTNVLITLETFLNAHQGEFIVLDIQHVNGIDYADASKFAEIRGLFEEYGLLDYAYSEDDNALKDITYGDITDNQTTSGIVILSKFEESDPQFFSYQASIRSAWANTDQLDDLYTFIADEASLVSSHEAFTGNQVSDNLDAIDAMDGFRVMQGVLTMQMSGEGIVEALLSWSLLERAKAVNVGLISQTDFIDWMAVLPIVMVDYTDTNKDGFLDNIMEIIIDFNENS